MILRIILLVAFTFSVRSFIWAEQAPNFSMKVFHIVFGIACAAIFIGNVKDANK